MSLRQKLTRRHVRAFWRVRVLPAIEPRLAFAFPPLAGERWRARRTGVYDEWTVIHDPGRDAAHPTDDLIRLLCAAATRAITIDLSDIADRAPRQVERSEINTWPGHHYRLLAALVDELEASSVVEIGTFTGASALTCASRPTVRSVVTYDIAAWNEIPFTLLAPEDLAASGGRIEQRLLDLQDPVTFAAESATLASADLIFVDGPKDGRFEAAFFDLLLALERDRDCCLVIDDVKVNTMVEIWQEFPLAKIDAASVGHWSGTGIVLLTKSESADQGALGEP